MKKIPLVNVGLKCAGNSCSLLPAAHLEDELPCVGDDEVAGGDVGREEQPVGVLVQERLDQGQQLGGWGEEYSLKELRVY